MGKTGGGGTQGHDFASDSKHFNPTLLTYVVCSYLMVMMMMEVPITRHISLKIYFTYLENTSFY